MTYLSSSPTMTEDFGFQIANSLISKNKKQAFIALRGDLGVGKTAFTRGFGRALGCVNIKSPTYTVVSEHKGNPVPLFHFDFYRLKDEDDLFSIGFDDYTLRDGYIVVEWSERIPSAIPNDAIIITISKDESLENRILEVVTNEDLVS